MFILSSKNTVHLLGFRESDLRLPVERRQGTYYQDAGRTDRNRRCHGRSRLYRSRRKLGEKFFKADGTYQKIAAVERHKNTGKIGVGIVKGFGLRGGAIASSVSHDSHNLIVIGDNDHDMYLAVQETSSVCRAAIRWLKMERYLTHCRSRSWDL